MGLTAKIRKQYQNFSLEVALDNLGKPLGLLGASGCGKSLTLRCIAGIATPETGKIVLNDRILYDSERRINLPAKQRRVGLLFQNYALFPNMSVRENILAGIKNHSRSKMLIDRFSAMLRLEAKLNQYPGQLSGGEQQRVALARMLCSEPEALLFDEPFSALDSFLKDQLQREFMEVLKEYQGDIIMVSHSRDELYRFCDAIAVIEQGRLVEYGAKEEVFGNPKEHITARLTGCKNISRARRISDHLVEATDWNICLRSEKRVRKDIIYVGIRAHNLYPTGDENQDNTLPVIIESISEGPFENHIILRGNTENPGIKLSWIVSRKEWNATYRNETPTCISLPKEHLLLLSEHTALV